MYTDSYLHAVAFAAVKQGLVVVTGAAAAVTEVTAQASPSCTHHIVNPSQRRIAKGSVELWGDAEIELRDEV